MVTTFHGLGLAILREHGERVGLAPGFGVADEAARLAAAAGQAGSEAEGRRMLAGASRDPELRAKLAGTLAARGLVDFDGLIDLPVALLRQEPGLAAALRERWRFVSVDEYQDIDAAQYALLRLLSGDGTGLTVIGDPDQAIYGFRGADVGFFLSFGRDYAGARTVQLTRNYRSSHAIVTSALAAVAPSTLVPGRTLHAVSDHDAAAPGRGGCRAGGQGPPARITVHEAPDEHAEAAWIARAIDQVLGGVSLHSLDSGRADGHAGGRIGLADVAVLYRTDAQSGPIGQELARAGLPVQKRSHDLLTRRAAVPVIVHELRLAGPQPGISVTAQLNAAVRRLTVRPAAGEAPAGTASLADVLAAGEVLAPLAGRCGEDLGRFLTEIALGAEADSLDPRAEAVTLLTLHAAKGLEFGVVFVAGCERGLLPLWLPGSGGPDLAEERRLLFVGMTRARSHLFLTCARRRRRYGTEAETGPSPFLAAIDPALRDSSVPRPRRPATQQLRLL